jgi:hypothetical protein
VNNRPGGIVPSEFRIGFLTVSESFLIAADKLAERCEVAGLGDGGAVRTRKKNTNSPGFRQDVLQALKVRQIKQVFEGNV